MPPSEPGPASGARGGSLLSLPFAYPVDEGVIFGSFLLLFVIWFFVAWLHMREGGPKP